MIIKVENIIPKRDRILVKIHESSGKTESGLEVVDQQANSAPVFGYIIAVGETSTFTIGQSVLFRRYSLDELRISDNGTEQVVTFLEDSDILGVINDDKVEEKQGDYSHLNEKKHANKEITNSDKESNG